MALVFHHLDLLLRPQEYAGVMKLSCFQPGRSAAHSPARCLEYSAAGGSRHRHALGGTAGIGPKGETGFLQEWGGFLIIKR